MKVSKTGVVCMGLFLLFAAYVFWGNSPDAFYLLLFISFPWYILDVLLSEYFYISDYILLAGIGINAVILYGVGVLLGWAVSVIAKQFRI